MKVVDASVVVDLLTRTDDRDLQERFRLERLSAPHLVDAEAASALHNWLVRGELTPEEGRRVIGDLADLPILRHDHRWLIARAWSFGDRMTVYDALYVALAEALEVPLWTRDQGLAVAAAAWIDVETV